MTVVSASKTGASGAQPPRQWDAAMPARREVQAWTVFTTLLARLIAMAGPFAVSVITARQLGPDQRGEYFLIISYAQIAAQFSNLGLHSSNTYFVANRPRLLAPLLVNSIVVACVVAPLAALPIAIGFGWPSLVVPGAASAHQIGPLALAAALQAPLLVSFLYLTNLAIGMGRVALFNGLTILSGFIAVVLTGLSWAAGGTLALFVWAAIASLAVSNLVGAFLLLRGQRVRLRFRARLFRIGAGYATRAFLATLFGFVLMRVGVVVLQLQANMAEVGQYSIAQQIGDALILLPSTVGLLLFPSLLRLPKGNDRWRAAMSAIVRLGSAMLVVVAIVAVATPLGVRLVFGPAYIAAAPLILGLLPTVLLTSIIIVFSQYLSASGFPWSQVAIWAAALLLHIALTLVLVGSLGAMGVVISLDCVNAFVLVALGVLAWRQREPRTTTEEAKPA